MARSDEEPCPARNSSPHARRSSAHHSEASAGAAVEPAGDRPRRAPSVGSASTEEAAAALRTTRRPAAQIDHGRATTAYERQSPSAACDRLENRDCWHARHPDTDLPSRSRRLLHHRAPLSSPNVVSVHTALEGSRFRQERRGPRSRSRQLLPLTSSYLLRLSELVFVDRSPVAGMVTVTFGAAATPAPGLNR